MHIKCLSIRNNYYTDNGADGEDALDFKEIYECELVWDKNSLTGFSEHSNETLRFIKQDNFLISRQTISSSGQTLLQVVNKVESHYKVPVKLKCFTNSS
jgi:hypothetical protein